MGERFIFLTDFCILKATISSKEKQISNNDLAGLQQTSMHAHARMCTCVCVYARMQRRSTYHYQYVEKCTTHNARKYTEYWDTLKWLLYSSQGSE